MQSFGVSFVVSLNKLLTHWGRVTHICVSDLTIIDSDNGLSPGRRQAIIRTNARILLKRPLGTNFGEILIEILLFSFMKMRLKVSSAKRRPFCRDLNVLNKQSFSKLLNKNKMLVTCDTMILMWHHWCHFTRFKSDLQNIFKTADEGWWNLVG